LGGGGGQVREGTELERAEGIKLREGELRVRRERGREEGVKLGKGKGIELRVKRVSSWELGGVGLGEGFELKEEWFKLRGRSSWGRMASWEGGKEGQACTSWGVQRVLRRPQDAHSVSGLA
jgi:hypothetical protein